MQSQFDDRDSQFRLSFDVRFNDVDHRHRITPSALFGFLQEAAIRQADDKGFGAAELLPRGLTWVINRMHLAVFRYPEWQDSVTVETWPSTAGGLYATREFRVFDADGAIVSAGTSRWVLVDISARRAVRMPSDIRDRFRLLPARSIEDHFAKLRIEADLVDNHTFHVRRSDLDANNHANSGRYFDWMLESAPTDFWENWEPSIVEIVYKQEALLGDTIASACAETRCDEVGSRMLSHRVRNTSRDGECAVGRSQWRRV